MAKFYFHFREGELLSPDDQGSDFPDVEEAYLSAFHTAQEMWRDLLVERRDPRRCSFEVNDAQGRTLFVLPFMEILEACRTNAAKTESPAARTAVDIHLKAVRTSNAIRAELKATRSSMKLLKESLDLLARLRDIE